MSKAKHNVYENKIQLDTWESQTKQLSGRHDVHVKYQFTNALREFNT